MSKNNTPLQSSYSLRNRDINPIPNPSTSPGFRGFTPEEILHANRYQANTSALNQAIERSAVDPTIAE